MNTIKKRRTALRSAFTRVANQLESLLSMENVDEQEIESTLELLQEKESALKLTNEEMFNELLEADATEDELAKEIQECDEYSSKYKKLKVAVKRKEETFSSAASRNSSGVLSMRKFKLPQIEFKKFGGDMKEWLPFWSQFRKIHEDNEIPPEDKFQYLLLAISPNTRARELVESYPPTAANYDEVVKSLKSRFGRDDMLVEVYVRELLKLVVNNALPNSGKCNLLNLYDKIEAQLRALETLGITIDTYAAMLYPLVESCLPEDLLRVWQRSAEFTNRSDSSLKDRLNRLIAFMKTEVESEERIALAVEGFGLGNNDKSKRTKIKSSENFLPTAAVLLNCEGSKCLFCEGAHSTEKCFKAQKMTWEQKRKVLIDKKACFRCAKLGHAGRRCRDRMRCVVCGAQHLVLLCPNLENKDSAGKVNRGETKPESANKNAETVQTESTLANYTDTPVFLQTLRVKLRSENREREVRAILDSGSQRSYVLNSTAQEMNYPVKRSEKIVHILFGGTQTSEQEHKCYDVRLSSLDGSYLCKFEVLDQPVICKNIAPVYPGIWTSELRRQKIQLTDNQSNEPIELLIGSDVLGKLITGKNHILSCGLVAMQTLLGWVLMGRVPNSKSSSDTSMLVTSLLNRDMAISDLWQLDVLGITDPGEKQSKIELEAATKTLFNETIVMNSEGRYEVCLPWRLGHPPLPSNEVMAKRRLDSTVIKLQNTGYYKQYEEIFTEWQKEGIIEEVCQQELSNSAHYLPHRPVIKEASITTKIRPVFDASAKEKGRPALNDCLEKGPNLIELIPSLLLRFRQEKIGVTADIKKAFLQISLNQNDRDFLRFIWRTEDGTEKVYRHKRVVFGVNASPFLLGATIEFHLNHFLENYEDTDKSYYKQTINKLANSFYVDNCVASLPDQEALAKFMKEATEIMARANFELRGWEYNGSPTNDLQLIPLLGLNWDKGKDVLAINYQVTDLEKNTTKRVILSVTQRIFDPIGFTCAATILPKLLLQKIWEQKISWDTEVDEDTKCMFQRWVNELSNLSKIEIPRWIDYEPAARLSIHTFCDASAVAYGAAIFLRVEKPNVVKIHLLLAKSRVAPIKKMTIPRLELLAACIGARLYTTVQEVFGKSIKSYFWSDSTTVLSWIRREEEWATFVWNRVREIRNLTSVDSWRHVPGAVNPADLLSRGCSPKYLAQSKWWEGPDWLYFSDDKWPQEENYIDESEINGERKKTVVSSMLSTVATNFYDRFSKYQQIVRMIGWIHRFVYNCRNPGGKRSGELSADEFESAEKSLIRLVQQEAFQNENDGQFSSLNVFRDEGILRVRTQISRREDCETFKYPFLLPQKHEVVKRLIFDTHVRSCHVGTQGLMNILRERYWILGGRRIIRSVISSCKPCKRHQAKSMKTITTELPLDRVRDAATFEIVGIDLAGPVYTKEGKVWICIFTCAVYRAVHLDITMSASTSDFLKTFRRFVARRGRPRVIYTDNGTNFCGAENIFSQLNWDEILQFSSAQRIVWRFNPPSAPWWGGWWERMIGLLKQRLGSCYGHYNDFTSWRPPTSIRRRMHERELLTPPTRRYLQAQPETPVP